LRKLVVQQLNIFALQIEAFKNQAFAKAIKSINSGAAAE